jgi:hypothetical protein
VVQRHPVRHPGAAVVADHGEPVEAERRHQPDLVGRHGPERVPGVVRTGVGPGRVAVAAQVGRDDRVLARQLGRDPVPHHVALWEAVQQQDRRSVATTDRVDPHVRSTISGNHDVDRLELRPEHGARPYRCSDQRLDVIAEHHHAGEAVIARRRRSVCRKSSSPLELDEEVHGAGRRRPQPLAPDIPRWSTSSPGTASGCTAGVVRRRHPQRRLRRRHPQRPAAGVHVLSGPIAVEGAEPGDLLIVDILDVGPIPQEDSGRWPARAGATPGCSPPATAAAS